VYQGYGRKLDIDLVKRLAKSSALGLEPQLTILLNLPVRLGLSRLTKRTGKTKMDEEPVEFHERIRQAYVFIAQKEPGRIRVVNAAGDIKEIQEEIRSIVLECLSE
jgi:dTMP kinase